MLLVHSIIAVCIVGDV